MSTATTIIEALGGWENISNLEACITRIRLDAANTDLIDEAKLRAAGAFDVVIVGDVLHSRVARSNVDLLTALGARVTLVAPPTLLPVGMEDWTCEVSYDLDEALALARPDAVMMLRVQRERMSAAGGGFFPSPAEYSSVYGLNSARRRAMPEHAIVMHPGPMNRGLEITAEAADDPRSRIIEQVGNGVSVRMAALYLLLADEGNQL